MPIHDYKCKCGVIHTDYMEKPERCIFCGGNEFEITYEEWTTVGIGEDLSALTDRFGRRRAFTASEDPTCAIELGLATDGGAGVRTFTPEQSVEYVQRMMRDGDTPQLRREILRQRAKNNTENGCPDSFETM